jgi:hypothetical protein
LTSFDLIGALNYYLVLAFAVGTVLRTRNYRALLGMVSQSAARWPKLRVLANSYRAVFLRWPTVLPVAVTLALVATSAGLSHFVYTPARVSPADLWAHPAWLAVVAAAGAVMGYFDFRSVFLVAGFDRPAVEAVLDRAEHWLGSWHAPAVRVLTAGLINPRGLVGEQVRQALVDASLSVNGALWVMSAQIVARAAFCLALWLTWAVALR